MLETFWIRPEGQLQQKVVSGGCEVVGLHTRVHFGTLWIPFL